jgi:membrane-bound lytic murein transglycosylase D
MRFANLYVRTVALASLALAACSCQTAQKPVALLPPGSAPALKTSTPPPATVPRASTPQSPAAQPAAAPRQTDNRDSAQQPARNETASHPSPPSASPDAIADLIDRVEKEYLAGAANYHAGRNEAAKQNFDNAFNALLDSKLDVRSDPRLEKEFERLSDGVNHLDLPGTQPGDASAEQKSEPAPIDETNEVTPAVDLNVKAKAQAEIKSTHSDLPLMMTDQVAGYINYFSNHGHGTFLRAFERSGRYREMMRSILKEEGVPQDLIYLAQAESGFHPLAVSRVGARGIWQFMGSRARGYGLERSLWVDDRQDPEKSTRAAARHLKDLYNQFGDWYLAMAAYNSGPGTVQAAVKRTGFADFWELYRRNVLPKETRNYVPIILAVTIMTKNPSQYGLDDAAMDQAAKYDTVTIDYPVDLRLVAECVDAKPAELQDLNPSLLRNTTPRGKKFELHLPAGAKEQYQTAIASIPANMRLWWRYHKVQPGDTLASLARTYRTTAQSITEANHLEGTELDLESKLVIPVAVGKHPLSDTATYARRITRYKVRRGDTVETVAENFSVSPQMLRRWNGLRGDSLRGRKVLALHLPVSPTSGDSELATSKTSKSLPHSKKAVQSPTQQDASYIAADSKTQAAVVRHRVKSGETLYSIANTYKTTVAALKHANRDVAVLRPGMILIVQQGR